MKTSTLLLLTAGILVVTCAPADACSAAYMSPYGNSYPCGMNQPFYMRPEPQLRELESIIRLAMIVFQSPFFLAPLAIGSSLIYWKNNAHRYIEALIMGIFTSIFMAAFLHFFGTGFLLGACQWVQAMLAIPESMPATKAIILGLTMAMVIATLVAQGTIFAATRKAFEPFFIVCSIGVNTAYAGLLASVTIQLFRIGC